MKRRDITLGEMQDECIFRGCDCTTLGGGMCDYFEACESMHNKKDNFQSPCDWNLTDPPRFTEAQMALLKAMYKIGAVRVLKVSRNVFFFNETQGASIAWIAEDKFGESALDNHLSLDLADLLGKDGAE